MNWIPSFGCPPQAEFFLGFPLGQMGGYCAQSDGNTMGWDGIKHNVMGWDGMRAGC